MSLDENKATVRRYLEELIGEGRLDLVSTICHADIAFHDPLGEVKGHDGVQSSVTKFRLAFPDLTYEVQRIIAEGEMVAVQTLISGTHLGVLLGVSGTGRKFSLNAMQMFVFTGGKIKEGWAVADLGGLFDQLGIERPGTGRFVD